MKNNPSGQWETWCDGVRPPTLLLIGEFKLRSKEKITNPFLYISSTSPSFQTHTQLCFHQETLLFYFINVHYCKYMNANETICKLMCPKRSRKKDSIASQLWWITSFPFLYTAHGHRKAPYNYQYPNTTYIH